jgi:hypothetical protein
MAIVALMIREKTKMPTYPLLNTAEDSIKAVKMMIEKDVCHFIAASRIF